MTPATAIKPPVWYWIVAWLALLWMLIGVAAWFMDLTMDEASAAQLSDAQRQLYALRPQWLFIVYAIAIFSGLLGAIALLLRKTWATPLLALSLIAVIVQFGYTFFGLGAIKLLGAATALPFPIVIFVTGVFLLWFSMSAKQRGWIAA
ncbi:MAG: hypothetical protein ABI132_11765 [Rhodanobacteraceae bacterium]